MRKKAISKIKKTKTCGMEAIKPKPSQFAPVCDETAIDGDLAMSA